MCNFAQRIFRERRRLIVAPGPHRDIQSPAEPAEPPRLEVQNGVSHEGAKRLVEIRFPFYLRQTTDFFLSRENSLFRNVQLGRGYNSRDISVSPRNGASVGATSKSEDSPARHIDTHRQKKRQKHRVQVQSR